MRLPWTRRPAAATPAPRPEVVQDGAGELGIRGAGAYSFSLQGARQPARLAERLDTIALIRRLGADVEEDS
jgi:hypothetical protein